MRSKLFAHLRRQWTGALALFLVLTGGTAYAANTVFSSDIVNGEVKTADIGNNQVRSADVRNDSLAGGGLTGVDIKEKELDVVQGRGTLFSNRIVQVPSVILIDGPQPDDIHDTPLLRIPGLGQLRVGCESTGAYMRHLNTTTSTIERWSSIPGTAAGGRLGAGDDSNVASSLFPSETLILGVGSDPGPRRIAVIHASVVKRPGGPCAFQVQGTMWSSE